MRHGHDGFRYPGLTSVVKLASVALALFLVQIRASPGDLVVSTDFRNKMWTVFAPKGTASKVGLELDFAQNAIKLKDGGDYEWYFEAPADFIAGDMALAYNGSILVQLQSLEWEGEFKEGYDIVLVSSKKGNTIGIKNIKKDGDTSRHYTVPVVETAGWEYVNPVRICVVRTEGARAQHSEAQSMRTITLGALLV